MKFIKIVDYREKTHYIRVEHIMTIREDTCSTGNDCTRVTLSNSRGSYLETDEDIDHLMKRLNDIINGMQKSTENVNRFEIMDIE